jgi:hypothetical protein
MDAMTLFMLVLLGMTFPIVAIVVAVLVDLAVMAWMAVDVTRRGVADWGQAVRVHWIRAAHP